MSADQSTGIAPLEGADQDFMSMFGGGPPPAPAEVKHVVAPTDLEPAIQRVVGASSKTYFYWAGVLPHCPREHLTLGATMFDKTTNILVPGNRAVLAKARRGSITVTS